MQEGGRAGAIPLPSKILETQSPRLAIKPDPLGARPHALLHPSEGKASKPQVEFILSHTRKTLGLEAGAGGSGVVVDRGSAPWSSSGRGPHLPHGPRPGPRTPAKRWAHGGTERPVAWSIRGLRRCLPGAPRNPRLLPQGAALPGRGRDALEAAGLPEDCGAQPESVRLRCEPRPRWLSRDAGEALDCREGGASGTPLKASTAPKGWEWLRRPEQREAPRRSA